MSLLERFKRFNRRNTMIDIHNDNNLETLLKIAKEEPLPDFVKQSDASLLATPADLPKEAFALESKRLYPMFDKASTWLSSRYFTKFAKEIPEPTRSVVGSKLKKACELFGAEWPAAKKPEPEMVKLAESDYAMVEKFEDKSVVKYPVNTKEATERSIAQFGGECALYPPRWRQKTADTLLKKAGEFKINVHASSPVHKYTCRTKSPETIKMAMHLRASYTKSHEFSTLYRGLIEKSAHEDAGAIIDTVEFLDKSSGLARYWDNGIPDPYLSVYKRAEEEKKDADKDLKIEAVKGDCEDGCDETEAKHASQSIVLAERNVPLSQLTQMPLEWYSDLLGEDIAKEMEDGNEIDEEKLKIILTSLPRPSQLLVVNNLPA